MNRLFMFVTAILLVLFLINSFVLEEKDADKIIRNKSGLVNIVFKTTDGGQTWQDISKGLPENIAAGKFGIVAYNYWGVNLKNKRNECLVADIRKFSGATNTQRF